MFGVGYKDVATVVSGSNPKWVCPIYTLWSSMLRRCYSTVFLLKNPSYSGAEVCEEWHRFETFRDWVISHPCFDRWSADTGNYQLDKDLCSSGGRVYGPNTCAFIPRYVNTLFNERQGGSNGLPLGVHLDKKSGKYKSQISKNGERHFLGYYADKNEAHKAWKLAKSEYIVETAKRYLDEPFHDKRVLESLHRESAVLILLSQLGHEHNGYFKEVINGSAEEEV